MARNKLIFLTSFLFAVVGVQALRADQLVTNGGFETGDFTGWTFVGEALHANATYQVDPAYAASGNYGALVQSPQELVTLSQNLTVVPGQSYSVSFSFAQTTFYTPPNNLYLPNQLIVTFAGQTLFSEINDPSLPYTNYPFLVTIPTSGSTTAPLNISLLDDLGYFYLDNVSVSTASPEPATFFLLAPVLSGLALLRRKRS